jgi:hypothetical protein
MSLFKQALQQDLDNTFFNQSEFAVITTVNEVLMTVILDDEQLKEKKLKQGEGLIAGDLLIVIRKSEFTSEPIIENRMEFDGDWYTVLDYLDSEHTYSISLERRTS